MLYYSNDYLSSKITKKTFLLNKFMLDALYYFSIILLDSKPERNK